MVYLWVSGVCTGFCERHFGAHRFLIVSFDYVVGWFF